MMDQARAYVVLCSSDFALTYAPLVNYYGLRFQGAFNFRDAEQYWGLEDFMNVTPTGVTNAAHLSLCMVNRGPITPIFCPRWSG
jgi:putative transposase